VRWFGMKEPVMEKTVSVIPKSGTEEVRVDLSEYRGHDLVSIRIYANYDSADEPKRPTKKGVTLKVEKLPELIAALQQAKTDARAAGLLSDPAPGEADMDAA
jgi:hypothetical protein